MKCFYRRFTIFGDKEGEMYTSDIYKEVTAVGKKKLFNTASGYFLFPRTRKLHSCIIFHHFF